MKKRKGKDPKSPKWFKVYTEQAFGVKNQDMGNGRLEVSKVLYEETQVT